MRPRPRPELAELRPQPHGGQAAPGVLDFSTGVSPLEAPPAILAAVRAADLARYPHPTAAPLRRRVAEAHGVAADEVACGAGSVELIWALARAFVGPGRHALVLTPAFGEYSQAVRASGGRVVELRATEPGFAFAARALDQALAARPSLAFICRPSNPCLSSVPADRLEELFARAPSTLFVIDEAYLPLYDGVEPVRPRDNVAVLRSLTKVFALPGLRLGYLLSERSVVQAAQAALPPWNVSSPAIAAGVAALAELGSIDAVRREVARLRAAMIERLALRGARADAAGGPFALYRVGDAADFTRRLFAEGVAVRDATSLGLPAHVRVGVRPDGEQERLAAAWSRACAP